MNFLTKLFTKKSDELDKAKAAYKRLIRKGGTSDLTDREVSELEAVAETLGYDPEKIEADTAAVALEVGLIAASDTVPSLRAASQKASDALRLYREESARIARERELGEQSLNTAWTMAYGEYEQAEQSTKRLAALRAAHPDVLDAPAPKAESQRY